MLQLSELDSRTYFTDINDMSLIITDNVSVTLLFSLVINFESENERFFFLSFSCSGGCPWVRKGKKSPSIII